MKKIITAFIVSLLFNACSIKEAPPLNIYTLNIPQIAPATTARYKKKVMKVSFPLALKEPLGYKMAYSYSRSERGVYQNSQWSNNIGKLIQGYIIQTLENSRLYKAVLPYESSAPEDMRLESVVYDFSHHVRGDVSYAVVSIEFDLIDMNSGKLIKSKRFSYKETTPTVNAKGYVEATNRAMERLSKELLEWLY